MTYEPMSETHVQDRGNRPRRPEGPEAGAAAQFGLRGLLWFVVACSAYCSQFAILREVDSGARPPGWSYILAIILAWLVLAAFHLTKGVRGMMVAHATGPTIMLLVMAVSSAGHDSMDPKVLVGMIAMGCFVSSLLSFPASVARTTVVALRKHHSGGP